MEHLLKLSHNVCFVRGMVEVCQDVLSIAQDEETSIPDRLLEISKYDSIDYKPMKPLPEHPSYRPKLHRYEGSEEYDLLTGYLGEELMHGYIIGKHACRSVICNMVTKRDGRSEKEILQSIVCFCHAVTDIAGCEK